MPTVYATPTPQLQVAQAIPPALDAGAYQLVVSQAITAGQSQARYQTQYTFTVAGPRFSIDPGAVFSRFPTPNGRGIYSNFLPQVILANASLPWSRVISPNTPVTPGKIATPFLGLLVVGDDDVADGSLDAIPQPAGATVGDLLAPITAQLLTPAYDAALNPDGIQLDDGESKDDPCNMVDLPAALFAQIAPSQADLSLLAHVRNVDQSASVQPPASPEGWFAALVANRFPAAGTSAGPTTSRVYLVSFEGLSDFLPDGDRYDRLASFQTVRLAVLSSWTFVDVSDGQVTANFGADVAALDPQPLALPTDLTPEIQQNADAVRLLGQGFVALNHVTRQGETTPAFYRGPLVPVAMAEGVSVYVDDSASGFPPPDPNASWACADAALRFDPDLGVFDVSLAAAWQLGRLLALQDVQFAEALQGFRRGLQNDLQRVVSRTLAAARVRALSVPREASRLLGAQPFRAPLAEALAQRIAPALVGDPATGAAGAFGPLGHRLAKNPNRARRFALERRRLAEEPSR